MVPALVGGIVTITHNGLPGPYGAVRATSSGGLVTITTDRFGIGPFVLDARESEVFLAFARYKAARIARVVQHSPGLRPDTMAIATASMSFTARQYVSDRTPTR
jgi:hypothetical protein